MIEKEDAQMESLREVFEELRTEVSAFLGEGTLEEETGSQADSLEHRWMAADGYGVVLTVCDLSTAKRPADLELLDMVGRSLARYHNWFDGETDEFVGITTDRFPEAWVCRLLMTGATGERLRVNLLAGLKGDEIVVFVQTMRSALIPDTEEDRGLSLLGTLAGSSGQ